MSEAFGGRLNLTAISSCQSLAMARRIPDAAIAVSESHPVVAGPLDHGGDAREGTDRELHAG